MKYVLIISLFLSFPSIAQEVVNAKVERALKSYLNDREGYKVGYQTKGNVKGYKSDLLLIHWTLLGATYWQNYLSAFDLENDEVSTIKLLGNVKGVQIKDNLIYVTTKQKAPNDPRCCPSLDEEQMYYLRSDKLVRVK